MIILLLSSCSADDSSILITLGDYTNCTYEAYTITVDEEAIADNIRSVFAVTHAIKHEITDRDTISSGDTVVAKFETYRKGKLYSSKSNEMFKVSAGHYLPDLEEQLIGKRKNVLYNLNVKIPDDYPVSDIAGETLQFLITVLDFYYYEIPEMTDAYFQELGYANYEDYFKYRIEMKYDDLDIYQRQLACQAILEQIADVSEFSLSPDEVEKTYNEIYNQYVFLSTAYELSLKDYVTNILEMDFDNFEEHCYERAEMTIKTNLIRDAIVDMNGFNELSYDKILEIGQNKYKLDISFLVENDARTLVINRLLYDFLLENATPIE